ncbi:hypothetical protein DMB38_13230 [Streptomyces sp. WAC 06738]|uniref:hypothetical protein n=1 Tax=Streptomyces sp. WAC 06738 TaxID=2203210 RepID=UPI000F6C438C|nr:hypothetical protein [Streptomyces sp. WAC 06738]AZM46642.1 hypothetical protein DMB38_13230 [Streptomyces sp. WAC 06738]
MTDIAFTPTFKHTPWVDNRDRVSASGPNGFNTRFDTLQKDLESLSGVVKTIDTAIKATGQVPSVERKLTLAPAFVAVPPSKPWSLDRFGAAVRPSAETDLTGMLTIAPPDGAKLLKFRAAGNNTGSGTLRISLFRAPFADASTVQLVARVSGAGAYDATQPVDPTMDRVDMNAFRYFVVGALSGAAVTDTVTVTSIQLTYLT